MPSAIESKLAAARAAVADLSDELETPEDELVSALKPNPDYVHLREAVKRAGKALGGRAAQAPLVGKAQRLDTARDA